MNRIVYLLAAALFASTLLVQPTRGQDSLRITEVMADNDGPVVDENGDSEDWIEIHNAGTNTVNLNGWYLSDKSNQLKQWKFPATNLPPNAYLLVFASSKDRRVPGATLHTNFRLNNGGEYLALTRPDGTNIASAYSPMFPVQVERVSYGIPVTEMQTTLLASGAVAQVMVPIDGSVAQTWMMPDFDDGAWIAAPSGLGYETDGLVPFVPTLLADSVNEFSGVQGQANWFYGTWNRSADANGVYADTEFTALPDNTWNGLAWNVPGSAGAYLDATGAKSDRPPETWAIRRYLSEAGGLVTLTVTMTHTSDWVYVEQSGASSSSVLYIYQTGIGSGYLDDVTLVAGGVAGAGPNLMGNGDFESGALAPWVASPNLINSSVVTGVSHSGDRSLRLVSTAGGTTRATSIYQDILPVLPNGPLYTLSFWYRPDTNSSQLVVRMSGNWIQVTPTYCGDGVTGRIFVDGQPVFQQRAFVSSAVSSVTVPVQVGSRIDFALDPGVAENDACDATVFSAVARTADPANAIVADSAADWSLTGRQGENNWFYGYYNKTADAGGVYAASDFTPFPRDNGPQSPSNFWDGQEWDWFSGNPPFDKIGPYWMIPNGTNSGAQHWAIRRWVSEVSGTISVNYTALKEEPDQNNLGGNGVTLRLFQNGVVRDTALVAGGDTVGINRTITINNVNVGDFIDLAVDPTGTDGRPHDGITATIPSSTDNTLVTMVVRGLPTLAPQIQGDLTGLMLGINAGAYLRFPFTVDDPAVFTALTMRLKYDDGFIAYLNGVEVARANTLPVVDWNSGAVTSRSDAEAMNYEEFNLASVLGLLRPGANVLAIHGLNAFADDSDFLILPELVASTVTYNMAERRYFSSPTPGAANGVGSSGLGPLITGASHTPNVPTDNENLTVTATVFRSLDPVSQVRMIYRTMYSNEVNVPMFDDGAHGDGAAGDGLWGATIPASASLPGQMLRYYVRATDSQNSSSRFPLFDDPKNSPEYLGTVVRNPVLTNPLPVLQFFVQNSMLASNFAGTRCSIFWDGEFYDNIGVNAHGQTTWYMFPKRSMNFNLNSGYRLRWKEGEERVRAFDLLTTSPDKAYLRLSLGFETFREAEVPTHYAFPVRVQQNNAFFGVMHFVEQANDDFLTRNGLDPLGAFYKIYLPLSDAYTGARKETRKTEPNDDLQALINGMSQTGTALRQYLFDHVDLAEVINFLATLQVVQNEDCCSKNYFLYRDTERTGEWQILPWDLDLTFGRTFTGWIQQGTNLFGGYYDTNIYWTNRWYTQSRAARTFMGADTDIGNAIFSFPDTLAMFYRRWSTVQEQMLQKAPVHPLLAHFERRVDEYAGQIGPDAILDYNQWLTLNPPSFYPFQTLTQAVSIMKTQYFGPRRGWVFNTLAFANGGPYLGTQPANASLQFGALDYNPSSGNQNQEYIQIRNPNAYSVDVSGWKLAGAVDFTFKNGTVVPSNGVVYVSPDVTAFRARTSAPRGGQGHFVVGGYKGLLSARGESLQIIDTTGRIVTSTNYPGTPSDAQLNLRITEIMFHPPPSPPGLPVAADEFEYIELKNIGLGTLILTGVRFTAGIEFDFTGSAVTQLGSGQSVVVVKNLAAFQSRYGAGLNVAGVFSGNLENAGELIRLVDATGEKILEFSYENSWYPLADGLGLGLVSANENAPWFSWGDAAQWRPDRSSPGQSNPSRPAVVPVLVNELLSASGEGEVDYVEIYNPTADDADLSGWWLSDDFGSPKKFRVPDGTMIPAFSYGFFFEGDFNANPQAPTSFSFSSAGDEVYLFSGDPASGDLTGYYHGFSFGPAEASVTFGRHVTSEGTEQFVAQAQATFLDANAGPRVGPVVLSEIHYHPPDGAGGADNSDDEFIELQEITGDIALLYDPLYPTNTWHLRGGVDFDFPADFALGPIETVLLVPFDPSDTARLESFRARLGVPPFVTVLGPYAGKLDNSADAIRLLKPNPPLPGEVPYVQVDAVNYKDSTPWPAADGSGASLQRPDLAAYGDDPIDWTGARPTPGNFYSGGDAPVITQQPASQNVYALTSPVFSVAAQGTAPLLYQWRADGTNVPGATNAMFALPSVALGANTFVSVIVYNDAGATVSSNATIAVLLPILFVEHPASLTISPGSNVTFRASAIGASTVTYQWLFNGAPLANATNTTYTIVNAQLTHAGTYALSATDAGGTVRSSNATLTVLVKPAFNFPPLSQTAVEGGTVTFSAGMTGTVPMSFRWRRGSFNVTNGVILVRSNYSTLTLTNVQLSDAASYNLIVTNIVPNGQAVVNFSLAVLADFDRDGLPDAWEMATGLDFMNPLDGAADPDQDGMSTQDEYTAGTEFMNPLSYLKLDFTVTGQVNLSFTAVTNRTYTIQFTEPASFGSWQRLADVLARPTNRVESFTDSVPASGRFYRIALPLQP